VGTIAALLFGSSTWLLGQAWFKWQQTWLPIPPQMEQMFESMTALLMGQPVVLMLLFLALVGRALLIAVNASTTFSRLLAGAIALIVFTYAFVNMGMVSGILPVVGVPLPFISYGGTALVTLGMACGMLMSIHRHRKLVQT
jgi:rod shape determining protein RodA